MAVVKKEIATLEADDTREQRELKIMRDKTNTPYKSKYTSIGNLVETITPTLVARADAAPARGLTPLEMLNAAIERGDGIDKLERLMGLNDRWEAAQAKKAFQEAKAAFKAEAPSVLRDKTNTQYKSKYTSIGNLVETITPTLAKHGLDASWSYEQSDSSIKCTCTLKHTQGHCESVTLAGPPDTSGAKNPLQQIKSTTTYLRIATFEAVTGIATRDGNLDDDGNGAGAASASALQPISEAQLAELIALADTVGADKARFCRYFQVASFAEITQDNLARATAALERKRSKPGAKP